MTARLQVNALKERLGVLLKQQEGARLRAHYDSLTPQQRAAHAAGVSVPEKYRNN